MLNYDSHMKTSRTNKSLGTVFTLCSLMMAGVAMGQATITPVPTLGETPIVSALNNEGAVAGTYPSNGAARAFLFRQGMLQDLGSLGGLQSFATSLNDSNIVAGNSDVGEFSSAHAFVFRDGTMHDLGVFPGGDFSSAEFINNAGDVAGSSTAPDGQRGFIFRNGQMTDIGSLGFLGFSEILDLNENGHVVGESINDDFQVRAFLYDGTSMTDLGTLGGALSSAQGINDLGVIVGHADDEEGITRAFVYSNGTMTDLGTLGGTFSGARGINNAGQIFGVSEYEPNNSAVHAFLVENGTMIDLGTLGGIESFPHAMNSQGHIVGRTDNDLAENVPFLYRDGQMVDVNTLLPPNSGWVLRSADFINDAGQIVGLGVFNGETNSYLFTPAGPNSVPVANAGPDQTVECSTFTQLDGNGSTDEDNDALTFEWRNGETVLGNTAALNVLLPLGTHTLTLVVTDVHDASDDDTVIITVSDTTAPIVTCPANQMVPAGVDCQAVVPNFATAAVASDSCSSVLTRSQSPAAGTSVGLGSHPVTVSITDESGNVGTCTVTLTVIDSTAPVGDCPPARTVDAGLECLVAVPDFTAALLATDNCTPAEALVKTQSPAAGTLVPLGSHVINLTVTDAAGNTSACSTTLNVVGIRATPQVTCPAPATAEVELDGKAAVPDFASAAIVVDSCSGPSTVTQTPAAGTRLGPGEYTVTVQAVDPEGHVGTCTTTFTVADNTPPTITSISVDPSLLTENGDLTPVTVSVTAEDNADPAPVSTIVSITSSEPVTQPGDHTSPDWEITGDLTAKVRAERGRDATRIYTITVVCTDASGNTAEATTTVTVVKKKGGGMPGRKVTSATTQKTSKAKKK
jgi:probable HAF family extracellular repeat protein